MKRDAGQALWQACIAWLMTWYDAVSSSQSSITSVSSNTPLGEPPGECGVAGKLGEGRPDSPTALPCDD